MFKLLDNGLRDGIIVWCDVIYIIWVVCWYIKFLCEWLFSVEKNKRVYMKIIVKLVIMVFYW